MFRNLLLCGAFLGLVATASAALGEDPHRWLEEVTGKEALAWVKKQNAESTAALARGAPFEQMSEQILKILDSSEKIPSIYKAGELYYSFWQDAKNPRGLWRRTTLEEYRKPSPAWEIVLDLDDLALREKENWVWGEASFLPPAYDRCLIFLSRGGAD